MSIWGWISILVAVLFIWFVIAASIESKKFQGGKQKKGSLNNLKNLIGQ